MGRQEGQHESTGVSSRGLTQSSNRSRLRGGDTPCPDMQSLLPLKSQASLPDHRAWPRRHPGRVPRGLRGTVRAAAGHRQGYLISMIDFHQAAKGHVHSGERPLRAGRGRPPHAFHGPAAPSFDLQHLDLPEPWKRVLIWVTGIPGRRLWPEHSAKAV